MISNAKQLKRKKSFFDEQKKSFFCGFFWLKKKLETKILEDFFANEMKEAFVAIFKPFKAVQR